MERVNADYDLGADEAAFSERTRSKVMDKRLKRKWIKALRSGEFKQTRGRLMDDRGYCCLGVLCVVKGMPDADIMNWSGNFDDLHPQLGGRSADLWSMNDFGRKSFSEIADYIEANL